MPLIFVRNDITRMHVDAVVNAANETLLGGGGVDGSIHRAAGPQLLEECRKLGGCRTGEAKLTGGYDMPCKYVIHTVGPIWEGGGKGEKTLLTACYQNSLALASEAQCESIAFPLISSGAYGYPKAEALQVAVETIRAYLQSNEMNVYLVVFDKDAFIISRSLYSRIDELVDEAYIEQYEASSARRRNLNRPALYSEEISDREMGIASLRPQRAKKSAVPMSAPDKSDLETKLKYLDESFSQMVLREIDERHMTDAECYRRANIDRKHFSKIRSDVHYQPKKWTAVALAVGLGLDIDKTRELLSKAGYALTHTSVFDIIVEYYIEAGIYDIDEINMTLYKYDQHLLSNSDHL